MTDRAAGRLLRLAAALGLAASLCAACCSPRRALAVPEAGGPPAPASGDTAPSPGGVGAAGVVGDRIAVLARWGHLYLVDPRDGQTELIGEGLDLAHELAVSPDGARIAAVAIGPDGISLDVFVVDVAQREVLPSPTRDEPKHFHTGIAWSPDSKRLAYGHHVVRGARGVWILDVTTAQRTPLTAGMDTDPAWSPDGQWIAFRRDEDGRSALYVVRPDGTGLRALLRSSSPGVPPLKPSWSPDGTKIAVAAVVAPSADSEVHCVDVATGQARDLTNSPGYDCNPVWSPDGEYIAFNTGRDGGAEVYLMRADGTGQRNLSSAPGWDFQQTWSAAGDRLAFVSERSHSRQLWVLDLAVPEPTQMTEFDGAGGGDVELIAWAGGSG